MQHDLENPPPGPAPDSLAVRRHRERCVLAAVLAHTMLSFATFLFPNNSSHYDPVIAEAIAVPVAAAVVNVWGARTLADNRFRRRIPVSA